MPRRAGAKKKKKLPGDVQAGLENVRKLTQRYLYRILSTSKR